MILLLVGVHKTQRLYKILSLHNIKQHGSNIGSFLSNVAILLFAFVYSLKHSPPHPHSVKVTVEYFIYSLAWMALAAGESSTKYYKLLEAS